MFESLGLENWTPISTSLLLGLVIGVLFGSVAQLTRFCLRRCLVGSRTERVPAMATWITALLFALGGTQLAVAAELINFTEHRFLADDLAIVAVSIGGLLFGIGMVLTRGCVSRLAVLSGSGNLRAILVLIVFAITAHATLKGVLSPIRIWLSEYTIAFSTSNTFANLPGGSWIFGAVLLFLAIYTFKHSTTSAWQIAGGAAIGLLVPLAWMTTGWLLVDDFDPIPMESLSFTLPSSQVLFWFIASTSISPGFGVGLVAGVLAGSSFMHLLRKQYQWQSFQSPEQMLRYLAGAVLMGIGGVLAGGCSVGAGLSGVSTLSYSALLALASIVIGAKIADKLILADPSPSSRLTASAQSLLRE